MSAEISKTEVPLVWTIEGNLPVDSLQYETRWEDTPDYTKFVETYRRDGKVVKESAHVYCRKSLEASVLQGLFG